MHTRPYRAIYTRMHIYPHVRADTRRWLPTNADGAADAWVRVHLYMASVSASMHKRRYRRTVYRWVYHTCARAHAHTPWNLRAHSYIYMYSCIRRRMHEMIHISWARACAAPDARAHAHALAWNPHIHPYASTRTHTYTKRILPAHSDMST